MRQITMILEEINEQQYADDVKQAAFRGIKLPPRIGSSNKEKPKFTKDVDKNLTEIAKKDLESWQNPKKI